MKVTKADARIFLDRLVANGICSRFGLTEDVVFEFLSTAFLIADAYSSKNYVLSLLYIALEQLSDVGVNTLDAIKSGKVMLRWVIDNRKDL